MSSEIGLEASFFDEKCPLDFDLKVTLVALLLNCNPKRMPNFPTFRIKQLLSDCTSFDPNKPGDFQVVDSVLSLYVLCGYFALSTDFEAATTLQLVAHFQSWLSEAIIVNEKYYSADFVMADLKSIFLKQEGLETRYKLEIFSSALEQFRSILRDTSNLARVLKQVRHYKDESSVPKDPQCVRPASVYFSLSFSLCHIILVLHSKEKLNLIPGLPEILLIQLLSKARENAEGDALLVKKSQELACFVAHCVYTMRTLQEVVLVRSRIGRHLLLPGKTFLLPPYHLSILILMYRTANFKVTTSASSASATGCKVTAGQKGSKMDFRQPVTSALRDRKALEEDDASLDSAGSSTENRHNDRMDMKQPSSALWGMSRPPKLDPPTERVFEHFRGLKRVYRMPFLVLQSVCFALGPFATAFESRYRPAVFTFPSGNLCTAAMPGLSSSAPVSQVSVLLEGALWAFCQLLPVPPRCLNPKQEAFWIVHSGKSPKKVKQATAAASLSASLSAVRSQAQMERRLLELEKRAASTVSSSSGIANPNAGPVYSVVWFCPPQRGQAQRLVTIGVESFSEDPLAGMPSRAAALDYASLIAANKIAEEQEEARRRQLLEDEQQGILAKNRARRAAESRTAKESLREQLDAKRTFHMKYLAEKAQQAAEAERRAAEEQRAREEAEVLEVLRIRDIKALRSEQLRQEEEDYKMELEMQKMFISKIVDDREAREIVRRLQEEARMQYLEERRRLLDGRLLAAEEEKAKRKKERHDAVAAKANAWQGRLRKGNFVWHNGHFGFYDNVRRELADYVQAEDANGKVYYYDPIYQSVQYREPEDAEVHHYSEDVRREYDALHGEGAYDAYLAMKAFQEGVNQYGGYYDDQGEWIAVNGYYDENGEWVEYQGYYDDQGRYQRFAKVSGDLNFMV
eukprot:scaffold10764_cov159-Ochromonas_danica.AAC.16